LGAAQAVGVRRQQRRHLTVLAGSLLALGHRHEIPGRLDIQLFAGVTADHHRRLPAGFAGVLLGRGAQSPARPVADRPAVPAARMRAPVLLRRRQRLALFEHTHSPLPSKDVELNILELRTATRKV